MEFINRGSPVKIRIGQASGCYWTTIRKGKVVDLTMEKGLAYGFSIKTTEGQIGNRVVETKQIDTVNDTVNDTVKTPGIPVKDFLKELCLIKGIGKKTAEDIIKIFPVREELIKKIRASTDTNALPFRENTCEVLMEAYGT